MPMEPLLPTFWRAQNNHIELGSDLNQNEKSFFSNGVICVVAEVNVDQSSKPCILWESSPNPIFVTLCVRFQKNTLESDLFLRQQGWIREFGPIPQFESITLVGRV